MDKRFYDIQIRSLRGAVDHLGVLDLGELDACARQYGTAEDRDLIRAIRFLLKKVPPLRH